MPQDVELCSRSQPFPVVCLRPRPDNTRSEARATAAFGRAHHWKTIIVVTTTYHVARARMLFRRCFSGRVEMVGAEPSYPQAEKRHQIWREYLALGRATLLRGC
jgi:uncharacterized SAM-binding protein YcdF (DUF218 family)